jgi:pimeloyl-ACP methyl ester carboxylesterase
MGIYGKRDIIVSPKQHKVMQTLVPHADVKFYNGAGHFPMMDTPDLFINDILDFLDNR